jgi:hypothetical protein
MATIGSLAVKLSLKSGDFNSGLQKAALSMRELDRAAQTVYQNTRSPLEKYQAAVGVLDQLHQKGKISSDTYNRALKQEEDTLASLTATGGIAIGAVAGVAGAVIGAAVAGYSWIKSLGRTVAEQTQLARTLGISQAEVAGFEMALHNMGISEDAAGKGIQRLNEHIVAATSGNSAAADAFDRIGLSAKDLARLPTGQALEKVADAIAAISDPTKRAAAAISIFDDQAAGMLPLLAQGSKGLAESAELAKKLGIGLDDVKANSLEDASNRVDELLFTLKGIGISIAAEVLPWITAIADSLGGAGETGKKTGGVVRDALHYVAKAAGYAGNAIDAIQVSAKFVELGFRGMIFGIARGLEWLLTKAAKLPESLGGKKFQEAADSVKGFADDAKSGMMGTVHEIDELLAKKPLGADWEEWFDKLGAAAENAGKRMNDKKGAGGALAELAKRAKLFQDAANVFNANKTPLRSFADEMDHLNSLLSAGALKWDVFTRASAKALENLERAHQLNELHLPSAAVRGTAAAASAVVQAENFRKNRLAETPQQRVERILEQSRQIEEKQLEYQKQIAEALKGREVKPVDIR